MSVKLDIIGNAAARLTKDGWEVVRSGIVTGLEGVDGDLLLVLGALVPGVPRVGTQHPSISFVYLEEVIPTYVDSGSVNLDLIYRSPDGLHPNDESDEGQATIEVGSTVEQVETYEDVFGNLLIVPYTDNTDPENPVVKKDNLRTIAILRPRSTKVFTWASEDNPSDLSETFAGYVNDRAWLYDPGGPPREWLCHSIVGRSKDGGTTYNVVATFVKNVEPPTLNYDVTLAWIDPATGKIAPGITEENGKETFIMYPSIDFNAIPIP